MTSWRTTIGFVAAGLGVLLTGVTQNATEPWILFGNVSLSGLGMGLTALGLMWAGISARDNIVTSEEVKAGGE